MRVTRKITSIDNEKEGTKARALWNTPIYTVDTAKNISNLYPSSPIRTITLEKFKRDTPNTQSLQFIKKNTVLNCVECLRIIQKNNSINIITVNTVYNS